MTVIDDYLRNVDSGKRKQLERIRALAKNAVPDAKEVISYGMPTLQRNRKSFLGFDAHVDHIGIYPFGGEEITVFKEQLEKLGYGYSKGAIRVPFDHPIPKGLLTDIIKHRLQRIGS